MTTALFLLRCVQLGLSMQDLELLTIGMNAISGTVSSIWNAISSGISTAVGNIYSTIKSGFEDAVNYIKGLAKSAFQWGADIINGIVDGIKSCIGKVKDAVSNVAETIKSFLHFSVPDVGPLADYESWMPDFMCRLTVNTEQFASVTGLEVKNG